MHSQCHRFLHQLRLRHPLLVAALLAVACTVIDTRVIGPNGDIAQLLVAPDTISLVSGQTIQFQAVGRTTSGETRPVAVTWAATGGTITSAGRYTADTTAGDFRVIATLDQPHLTAEAKIRNRGSLKEVVLLPASATVAQNAQLQFSASGRVANGTSVTISPTYTATGGTINESGIFTAGSVDGDFHVIATAVVNPSGNTVADTSPVTVGSGPAPVATVVVAPATATVQVGATVQLTATTKDANSNTLTGRVITWSSSNTGMATVNPSTGLVTGVAVGTPTITATSETKTGTAAITVTAPPPPGSTVVFVGAGDISDCGNNNDEATAQLLDGIAGTVYTLGDNVYDNGTLTEFNTCYDPTWGRHKARTRPSPGNHDYHTSGAAGYFAYFGSLAGPSGLGYYSFDLGDWHIISLNSEASMSAGSAQETWLRADLLASTKQCTLAYWHHPRFSSGTNHGSSTAPQPLWQALYDDGAEIVLVGHEHNYERFAPQTPTGVADAARGIRQFVAGTGGRSHYSFGTPIANSEVRNGDTYGVLKLTLGSGTYAWQFVPVGGPGSFTDSGSGTCH